MIKIYYADISSIQDFESFTKEFSCARLNYVYSISDNLRKKQSVMVWWLLLKVLKEEYELLSQFDFCLNETGKWYEKNNLVNISLSHSKNIVLVGVTDNLPISVDVEQVGDKLLSISKLYNTEENVKTSDLLELAKFWTKRECVIKDNRVNLFTGLTVFDKCNNQYYLNIGIENHSNSLIEILKVNID
ncbi:MAG: hypothetical protein IKB98_05655 [Clostridia bacterium]|nr:hypothetical protein [Clostridia bacterium]